MSLAGRLLHNSHVYVSRACGGHMAVLRRASGKLSPAQVQALYFHLAVLHMAPPRVVPAIPPTTSKVACYTDAADEKDEQGRHQARLCFLVLPRDGGPGAVRIVTLPQEVLELTDAISTYIARGVGPWWSCMPVQATSNNGECC